MQWGKLIGLLILPFYTRWLSTEDYGITDIITIYVSFFLGLVTCCIAESIFIFPKGQILEFLKKLVNSAMLFDVLDDSSLSNCVITGLKYNIDGTKVFGRTRTLKIRNLDESEDVHGIYDALKSYAEISDNDIIVVGIKCLI